LCASLGFASLDHSLDHADDIKRDFGARCEWTPCEIEHAAFSMGNRPDLLKNAGISFARFSALLFPHQDKERFVNTIDSESA
jgi:hypothetical protein